ncbi:MAG: XdhC/CoxI family protein [Nitrososphaerota archaeon]
MSYLDIYKALIEEHKNGRSVVLATIVKKTGSAPRDVGARILVREDGSFIGTLGGGSFEMMVWRDALGALREGKPTLKKYVFRREGVGEVVETGLICGGEVEVFMDVLKPMPKIVLIGAGHLAQTVSKIAVFLGYKIAIVDVNPEFASKERFPDAEELIISKDLEDWVEKIHITSKDVVLIVYGGVEEDYKALRASLRTNAKYIGLLGSKRKCAEFLKRLKEEGYRVGDLKERLYMPVGIDIGADTPEEIAVAIMAEIVKVLKGGTMKHLSILIHQE